MDKAKYLAKIELLCDDCDNPKHELLIRKAFSLGCDLAIEVVQECRRLK